MLGYPSVVELKTIIKTNAIWDNPVTKSNAKLMEHLFGPDIPTIKGKTTRRCPHQLVSSMVSIPHQLCDAQHDACLYIDIMYVNGMPFLTTISKNIKYHTTMWVADHNTPTITSLVESILKLYQQASFQVMEVCTDCEFKPVLQVLQDGGWSFMTNLANAQEHVPEAECNNHVLKEHIHTTYHGIPYKMLPQTIICYMVMETSVKLNYFTSKGGWSNYFILREILHHVKLDYKKHCSMPLLSYVLTHDEPTLTNTVHMHALDCLFLHAIKTKQGGYECYHIPTCQVITQPYVTVVPTTPTIIATINALGKSDGIQSLKITNLFRHLLFDSSEDPALLAGVDDADDADDKDTSLAGVHGDNTSLARVPVPNTTVTTNNDDPLDSESDHNSVDPKGQ